MKRIALLIVLLLLLSGFTYPPDPHVDVYRCECGDPVDNIRLCYCARDGTVCGNYCEYFYWTQMDDIESWWYMCDGFGLYIPMAIREN